MYIDHVSQARLVKLPKLSDIIQVVTGWYLLEVRIFGYSNPTGRCQACHRPINENQRSDCDSESESHITVNFYGSGDYQCDSYFTYCSREFFSMNSEQATSGPTVGCHFGEMVQSTVNVNDRPVNFSQGRVLGLDNPFQLQRLSDAYNEVLL